MFKSKKVLFALILLLGSSFTKSFELPEPVKNHWKKGLAVLALAGVAYKAWKHFNKQSETTITVSKPSEIQHVIVEPGNSGAVVIDRMATVMFTETLQARETESSSLTASAPAGSTAVVTKVSSAGGAGSSASSKSAVSRAKVYSLAEARNFYTKIEEYAKTHPKMKTLKTRIAGLQGTGKLLTDCAAEMYEELSKFELSHKA